MTLSGRRMELWVEARDGAAAVNPVVRALLDDLAGSGAVITVRVPEHEVTDPLEIHGRYAPDAVLLKSATTLALSLAMADEASGVRFLNGARTTLRAHDKAATIARLASAGLPAPETFLLDPSANGKAPPPLPPMPGGAWVAKPTRGVHGRGVEIHSGVPATLGANTLDAGASHVVDDGTRLLQRRVGGGEEDVKVYVAGESVFAGRKAYGPRSYATDDVAPAELDPHTEEVVRAAGEALGLRLFGVDLRFEDGDPVIIDANPFPGYRGFPESVPALRAEIERFLKDRS